MIQAPDPEAVCARTNSDSYPCSLSPLCLACLPVCFLCRPFVGQPFLKVPGHDERRLKRGIKRELSCE